MKRAARSASAPARLLLVVAACATAASAALGSPAMSIRELRTLQAREADGSNYANYYLVGVMEGLREAADAAQRAGGKPAFCVQGRRLEPAMARSLYEAELKRNAHLYEADMPVPLVLAAALQGSFRCKE